MSDPGLVPSLVGGALGAKLLYDVCGPTAKYFGGGLASVADKGVENLKSVFLAAKSHLDRLGDRPGQVAPRVLRDVVSDGYFCEDELVASYLGGVLASAKTTVARDDRALAYTAQLSSLSTYQIRIHYLLYCSILDLPEKDLENVIRWVQRGSGSTIFVSERELKNLMEFHESENDLAIMEHAFIGLNQRNLLEQGLNPCEPRQEIKGIPNETFRCFWPTISGLELFLWGVGMGGEGIRGFTSSLMWEGMPPSPKPIKWEFGKVQWG